MKSLRRFLLAVGFSVVLLVATSAHAQSPALTSITGGSIFATFQTDGDTVGWSFTANQAILVVQLGFNDVTPADGFLMSHAVGLWDNAGTLLGSVVVTGSETLVGGFRYVALTVPVALLAGQSYILGAFYDAANTTQDGYVTTATSITTSPAITFIGPRRDPDGAQTGLVFPSVTSAGNGRFGPNLLFTAVPEPSSVGLIGTALAGGILFRRRRRK